MSIGPGCVIRDTVIEPDTEIRAHCVIEGAHVGVGCLVGPFARLRPDARLARGVHVGNFVEVKNTALGESSKANHLTYIGDSRIGRDVNVGAGVVTCNYDGASKHTTVIEDNVFIGSGTMLVAPITVHAGADDRGRLDHREGCAARCPDGDPGRHKRPSRTGGARASAESCGAPLSPFPGEASHGPRP